MGNPVHRFYQQQYQINGGKMDRFIPWGGTGGLVMSYYDATNLPHGKLAQGYVLADNFFHAAFGGSFLNHTWLICACTPYWPDAPAAMRVQLDPSGMIVKDGDVTPDGYVVSTAFTVNAPHPQSANPSFLLPNLTLPTIGDRLDDKGISWAWYAGGWRDGLAGKAHAIFLLDGFDRPVRVGTTPSPRDASALAIATVETPNAIRAIVAAVAVRPSPAP